ncbi:MAG: hypothetical protein MJZ51_03950 [Bacteroidales bacterium]|nr:hypothetical protein [Bacteroidales bacterium]
MKRIMTLAMAFISMMVIAGCTKECEECDILNDNHQLEEFLGTYDLAITYTTEVNGEVGEGTSELHGTLSIRQQEDPEVVEVIGVVNISGQEVTFYSTLGYLNQYGQLQLEPSTYINPNSGLAADITYEPIIKQTPLLFRSELNAVVSGMVVTYNMENTCNKID